MNRVLHPIVASASIALLTIAAACMAAGTDQPLDRDKKLDETELARHPWVVPPPNLEAKAYFTNIKDGDSRESPFLVRFGLSMRGLVPAGHAVGRAGHHHLLINKPMPLDFTKPLPFTDQYIHFGAGQMETVLDLKPGTYQLTLLLADQGHIPYFVHSRPISVTVTRRNKTPAAILQGKPRIEMLSPTDKETLVPPFRVQFHASGYDISNAAPGLPETYHFRLTMERSGKQTEVVELRNGHTETWLQPPQGEYRMNLELVSNQPDSKVVASAKAIHVVVEPPNGKR